MNWTGGRLQRHSKSNSNKILKAQKEYFAKLRSEAPCDLNIQDRSSISFFGTPITSTVNHTGKRQKVDSSKHIKNKFESGKHTLDIQTSNNSLPYHGKRAWSVSDGAKQSQLAHAQHSTKTIPENTKADSINNSIESTRHDLLHREDWLRMAALKPLGMRFSPTKEIQRIGRHRKLEDKAVGEDRSMQDSNRIFKQRKNSSRRTTRAQVPATVICMTSPAATSRAAPLTPTVMAKSSSSVPCLNSDSGAGRVAKASDYFSVESWLSDPSLSLYDMNMGDSHANRRATIYPSPVIPTQASDPWRKTTSAVTDNKNSVDGCIIPDVRHQERLSTPAMEGDVSPLDLNTETFHMDPYFFPVRYSSSHGQTHNRAATHLSSNEKELLVRKALANDFEQAEKEFEFLPTPSRRKKPISSRSRRASGRNGHIATRPSSITEEVCPLSSSVAQAIPRIAAQNSTGNFLSDTTDFSGSFVEDANLKQAWLSHSGKIESIVYGDERITEDKWTAPRCQRVPLNNTGLRGQETSMIQIAKPRPKQTSPSSTLQAYQSCTAPLISHHSALLSSENWFHLRTSSGGSGRSAEDPRFLVLKEDELVNNTSHLRHDSSASSMHHSSVVCRSSPILPFPENISSPARRYENRMMPPISTAYPTAASNRYVSKFCSWHDITPTRAALQSDLRSSPPLFSTASSLYLSQS